MLSNGDAVRDLLLQCKKFLIQQNSVSIQNTADVSCETMIYGHSPVRAAAYGLEEDFLNGSFRVDFCFDDFAMRSPR